MMASERSLMKQLTAAQTILLAADDLASSGVAEFSEWDLTMASWLCDKEKFGLRGYAADHPDHKRVSMEIMGSKPHSPVVLGYLAKVRPNTYQITHKGRKQAGLLRKGIGVGRRNPVPLEVACPMPSDWQEVMEAAFADDPAARAALKSLWAYLCRHPKADRFSWNFANGLWVASKGAA